MSKISEFLKWYIQIDFKDVTNYIAIIMAILLLWWGIKSMITAFSIIP
ncbi:hypothetical protein HQ545_08655 [Candidatus Woesearchaeota archaeon]|nr:hypothetical protein [Candidatus Woesearchaeota archaeon]